MTPRQLAGRAQDFFGTRIWTASPGTLGRGRAFLYRVLRTAYAAGHGFFTKQLPVRAAALTYYTVLSLVPFLAFAFSALKGFGLYHRLIEGSLRPYLQATLAGDSALLRGLDQTLSFVERTNVAGLGAGGVFLLLYTAVSMLSTVEAALNAIWDVPTPRSIVRRVTDYTTLMVAGPLLATGAITMATAAQNSALVEVLRRSAVFRVLIDFAPWLMAFTFACAGLVTLYIILPNTHTRFSSALVGGVAAGVAWQAALLAQVKFQIGVAEYNALYAGFAAFPIFVFWIYVSWNIVLVGAQLAASHQHEARLRQAVRSRHVDQELRENLALALAALCARRFVEGRSAATAADLAEALDVPPPAVDEVLAALVAARVLARVADADEPRYVPAQELDGVRVAAVERAVRSDPGAAALKSALERTAGPALASVMRARRAEADAGSGALTLRQVAAPAPAPSTDDR